MDRARAHEPACRTQPRPDPVPALVRDPGRAVLAVPAPAADSCAQGVRQRQPGAGDRTVSLEHVLEHGDRRPAAWPHVGTDPGDLVVLRRVPGRHDRGDAAALALAARAYDGNLSFPAGFRRGPRAMKTLFILAFLGLIIYNLGAGLYYMLVDTGRSKRTVNALTRRIVLSIALIGMVAIGIYTGVIDPHGVGA